MAHKEIDYRIEPGSGGAKWLASLRILLGLVFLWPFFDKLFALGYTTGRMEDGSVEYFGDAAWLFGAGASPTNGFLSFGTKGPFAEAFQSIAGTWYADWGFMLSLLLIGLAVTFGVSMRIASIGGAVLLMLMYFAAPPWASPVGHSPLFDDHVIYAVAMIVCWQLYAGHTWGLGLKPIAASVEKYAILR